MNYDAESSARGIESYNYLKKQLKAKNSYSELSRGEILNYIREYNIANDLLGISEAERFKYSKIKFYETKFIKSSQKYSFENNKTRLHIKVMSGTDFIDYVNVDRKKVIICDFFFHDQRRETNPVICSEEPIFGDDLMFELQLNIKEKINIKEFITENKPLYLTVIELNYEDNQRKVLNIKRIDWKDLLYKRKKEEKIVLKNKTLNYLIGIINVFS